MWAGDLEWLADDGTPVVTNWTGYSLTAHFSLRDNSGGPSSTRLHAQTVEFLSRTQLAQIVLTVASAVTARWPVGAVILVDVVMLDPAGVQTTTNTFAIETEGRA